jgi:cytidylate kinase
MFLIIAIDGPSAAGKSTVAREIAGRLRYRYLDSGLTYRAVGWAAIENNIDPGDEKAARELMNQLDISLEHDSGSGRMLVNGRDVTGLVRTREVSEAASVISRFPFVREKVVAVQRGAGRTGNLVAEGRDMGTVVFPEAPLKFFLEATPEVRARRRLQDWDRLGVDADYDAVLRELRARDERDSTRQASPLRPAHDAIRIDTSDLTVKEVVETLLEKVSERRDATDMV